MVDTTNLSPDMKRAVILDEYLHQSDDRKRHVIALSLLAYAFESVFPEDLKAAYFRKWLGWLPDDHLTPFAERLVETAGTLNRLSDNAKETD